MTGDDLIAIAPWLGFAAGLAMIGYRLLPRGVPRGLPRGRPPAPPGCDDERQRPS